MSDRFQGPNKDEAPYPYRSILSVAPRSAFRHRLSQPARRRSRRRQRLFTNRHLREGSQLIRQDYVDGDKTSYHNLITAALKGMLGSLDPHSQFMDPSDF